MSTDAIAASPAAGAQPVEAVARLRAAAAAAAAADTRVVALDGVRGVAIGLVVLYHLVALTQPWASASRLDHGLWKIAGTGWAGVDLFFVLSGFLITGILLDAKPVAQHYFRSFFARRALRILPLNYVFLALLIVALPVILPSAQGSAEAVRHGMPWYGTFTMNFRPIFDDSFHPDLFYTGHLWSLAVEEQFYLVWPFVVLVLGRRQLMAACAAAIVGALVIRIALDSSGVSPDVTSGLAPARMDVLAMGALIALVVRDPRALRTAVRWLPLVASVAAAGLFAVAVWRGDLIPPFDTSLLTIGFTCIALVFGSLVLGVLTSAQSAPLPRLLSAGVLGMLGRYSYALYLFHVPAGTVLLVRTDLPSRMPELFGSTLPGIAVFVTCGALISLGLAWLSWNVLEKQCFKLKRYFPYSQAKVASRGGALNVDHLPLAADVAQAVPQR